MRAIHRVGPETDRLVHRAFEPEDAEVFFALRSDPEVNRHTHEEPLATVEAARAAIEAYPDFARHGFGRWACVLKEEGRVVGFSGLKRLPELDAVDLGYRFLPETWGRGLATESGRACVDFGFDVLGLDEILALVLPDNRASIRVLEKLGFVLRGELTVDGRSDVQRHVLRRSAR